MQAYLVSVVSEIQASVKYIVLYDSYRPIPSKSSASLNLLPDQNRGLLEKLNGRSYLLHGYTIEVIRRCLLRMYSSGHEKKDEL